MVVNVYSIYDEKAKYFGKLTFFANDDDAKRAFGDLVVTEGNGVNRHPGDFKIYKLGTFDDNSGLMLSCPMPEFLAHGTDYTK